MNRPSATTVRRSGGAQLASHASLVQQGLGAATTPCSATSSYLEATGAHQAFTAVNGTQVVKPGVLAPPPGPSVTNPVTWAPKPAGPFTAAGKLPPAPARGILKVATDGAAEAANASRAANASNTAKTVQVASLEMSTATKVVGGVSGGLTIAAGLIEIGSGLYTLSTDHPDVAVAKMRARRSTRMSKMAPSSEAAKQQLKEDTALLNRLWHHQNAEGSVTIGTGATNVTGGALMVAGACASNPVTLAAGGIVALVAGGIGGARAVGCSFRDYKIRAGHWEHAKQLTAIRRSIGSVGKPCKIDFSGSGWCQIYAEIEYTSFDGEKIQLLSCDHDNAYNWYSCFLELEPDISNLRIKFAVRGGATVKAVDRSKPGKPWRRTRRDGKKFTEVFSIPDPSGKTLRFDLAATSLHAYVNDAQIDSKPLKGYHKAYTPDFAALLGVSADDGASIIARAYRRLSLRHHPDKGGDADQFEKIKDAHEAMLAACEK